MASLIGHNNPPKDRKVDWKSVSLNKYVYKQLQQLAERRMNINNCFGLLDGKAPQKAPQNAPQKAPQHVRQKAPQNVRQKAQRSVPRSLREAIFYG